MPTGDRLAELIRPCLEQASVQMWVTAAKRLPAADPKPQVHPGAQENQLSLYGHTLTTSSAQPGSTKHEEEKDMTRSHSRKEATGHSKTLLCTVAWTPRNPV